MEYANGEHDWQLSHGSSFPMCKSPAKESHGDCWAYGWPSARVGNLPVNPRLDSVQLCSKVPLVELQLCPPRCSRTRGVLGVGGVRAPPVEAGLGAMLHKAAAVGHVQLCVGVGRNWCTGEVEGLSPTNLFLPSAPGLCTANSSSSDRWLVCVDQAL